MSLTEITPKFQGKIVCSMAEYHASQAVGSSSLRTIINKSPAHYLYNKQNYNLNIVYEHLEKIKLPFLPTGKHRAFPIKGDSMLPMKSGSYVVGCFIEDRNDINAV